MSGAAFDSRYIAVVFPLFVLLCALGLTAFISRAVTSVVLAVACVAGLFSAQLWNSQPRTQAVQVAAVLNAQAQPGDMVVYCPDQLGPAVDRLLTVPDVTELTYPRMMGPQRIDWIDYAATIQNTSPAMVRPGDRVPAQPREHPVAGVAQRLQGVREQLRRPGQLAGDVPPRRRDRHEPGPELLRAGKPRTLPELKHR